MGLGDLFKRLTKGASEEAKAPAPAPRTKGGKVLPPIPSFLKKDRFVREAAEAPSDSPPEAAPDMADMGSFKRPGQWLKARLGGTTDSQAINNIEKTKTALKKSGGLNDQEIQSFLDGLLEEPGAETAPGGSPPALPKSTKPFP